MTLPGTVSAAAGDSLGFDTDGIVTAAAAAAFFAQGFQFCIRYVSRVAQQNANDLSAPEALDLLNAGLALMPVQHVRGAGWSPTAALGSSDGVHAAYHAFVIGFPPGVNIWCDLEGVEPVASAQQVINYCNAWFDAVDAAGYVPGIYVGADAILEGPTLRHSLKFAHYWKSLSRVPDIPGRGYQMIQSNEHDANGVSIDENRTQTDLLGGAVLWLAPAPAATV
jgi:hypothetical protein